MHRFLFPLLPVVALALTAGLAVAAEPVRLLELGYIEGDVAGLSSILSEDGASVIGYLEYRQHRRGDLLEISRVAHFQDGSSDEDTVVAEVGKTLRTVKGRIIIRNTKGAPTIDISIDVAAGRIKGFYGDGKKREQYDEAVEIGPDTYWGPLVGLVLKNFDQNATGNRLVFHSVVVTPKPRLLDMELVRKAKTSRSRSGSPLAATLFALSPTINFVIDPFVKMIAPRTSFFMLPGAPPAMGSFEGPRNYAGQTIRIE